MSVMTESVPVVIMSTQGNPFTEGTDSYRDYETLKDLEPHCSKCELVTGQAKTWQTWRDAYGYQFSKTGRNYCERIFCSTCGKKQVHRRLTSLTPSDNTTARSNMPKALAARIKVVLRNRDEYANRFMRAVYLEVDHRCPRIRATSDEEDNRLDMSEEEINERFMLLSRSNNLTKSRACEKCVETGKRSKGHGGVAFWYEGTEDYDAELGCVGCPWYSPDKWRSALQARIDGEPVGVSIQPFTPR